MKTHGTIYAPAPRPAQPERRRAARAVPRALLLCGMLALLCGTLASCANGIDADAPAADTATLSLSVDSGNARTIMPSAPDSDGFDTYTLTGSGAGTYSKTWTASGSTTAYAAMVGDKIPISMGTWNFTLTATTGGLTYTGTTTKEVTAGTNALSFTLALKSIDTTTTDSTSGFDVTVTYPAADVRYIEAVLLKEGGSTTSEEKTFTPASASSATATAQFAKSFQPGTYIVRFTFYGDTAKTLPLGTWREYVIITAGCTSTAARTIESLESVYAITYERNGGAFTIGTQPASYSRLQTTAVTLPTSSDISRTGYTFDGWYESSSLSGSPVTEIPAGSTSGNKTYYAKWTPTTYSITFDGNQAAFPGDGTTSITGTTGSVTATYDQACTLPANGFTYPGYTFTGWNTKANGTGTLYADGATIPAATINAWYGSSATLYAQWAPATDTKYTVLHRVRNEDDTGYVIKETEFKTGTTGELTDAEPYTYTGFETPDVSDVTQKTIKADGTTQVTINYERKSFTVTYDGNGAMSGVPNNTTVRYGASVTVASDVPVRSGYEFNGWTVNGNFTKQPDETITTSAQSDYTLVAIWTQINSISITVNTISDTIPGWSGAYSVSIELTVPEDVVVLEWTVDGETWTDTDSLSNDNRTLTLNTQDLNWQSGGVYNVFVLGTKSGIVAHGGTQIIVP